MWAFLIHITSQVTYSTEEELLMHLIMMFLNTLLNYLVTGPVNVTGDNIYRKLDLTVESRLKAWFLLSN